MTFRETTNREADHKAEKELHKYLQEYFYKKIYPKTKSFDDKPHQLKGIDVILNSGKGENIIVDEKGMSSRTGYKPTNQRPWNTFCFEISSIQKESGERVSGWLVVDNATQSYFLVWYTDCAVPKNPDFEDIYEIEAMLVSKQEVLNLLADYGKTKEVLLKDNETILNTLNSKYTPEELTNALKGEFGKGLVENIPCDYRGIPKIHYSYSNYLAEKPVNIIIDKNLLKNLPSTKRWIITPDEVKEV